MAMAISPCTISCGTIFSVHYDYFETPAVGLIRAKRRRSGGPRMPRRTGLSVRILAEIGYVDDFYNLIGRENHSITSFACGKAIIQGSIS
jgi:hypothetical protein